jgi:hypothetical protein
MEKIKADFDTEKVTQHHNLKESTNYTNINE